MSSHVAILPALALMAAITGCSSDETSTSTATQRVSCSRRTSHGQIAGRLCLQHPRGAAFWASLTRWRSCWRGGMGGWWRTVGGAPAPLRSRTRVAAGAAGGGIAPGASGVQNGKPLTVDADLVTTLLTKVTGATFRDDRQSIWVKAALPRVRIRCEPEQRGTRQDNADRGTRQDACPPVAVPGDRDGSPVSGCDAVASNGSSFRRSGWS